MSTAIKLNPTKFLSQLADSNSSGCLKIDQNSISWKIYLQKGKLQYVDCSAQLLEQIKHHLVYLEFKSAATALKDFPISSIQINSSTSAESSNSELYSAVILWLLSENHLHFAQATKLVENISKDLLQFFFWLDETDYVWKEDYALPLWIPTQIKQSLSLNISECLKEAELFFQKWQNCSPELHSVHQRPYFPPSWETKNLPASGVLNQKTLMELTQVLRGRTSIRQLSILLKKDELTVAQILSPYIDEKIIYLHHASPPLNNLPAVSRHSDKNSCFSLPNNSDFEPTQAENLKQQVKIWKIVCIDDSPTILSEMQRFLGQKQFQVTAIDDPVQAVSKIFNINPDLILLDITMPRINGYKLCGLLRNSGKCDQTPIIMVTGNTGLIDKARAKLSGATDYFTKPFTKEGLNQIVAKYLPLN